MAAAVAPPLTSAAGILTLLEEEENDLRAIALEQLDRVVDQFWAEIANSLSDIEALHEDPAFSHRDLAALVAAKVFYHLEEYGDALRLALAAGDLFQVESPTQFAETVVGKAIEQWIQIRKEMAAGEAKEVDPRLERVVMRTFEHCEKQKEYKQALGIAMDAHHLELIEKSIRIADNPTEMMQYVLHNAQTIIMTKKYRDEVLQLLVKVYSDSDESSRDWGGLCECYFYLDQAGEVADILASLLAKGAEDPDHRGRLLAYQIAFDLASYEKQTYLSALLAHEKLAPLEEKPVSEDIGNLRLILSGKKQIELYLEFLYRNNHTDLLLLDRIKTSVDGRQSMTHNAIVICHSLMQCGTTSDVFLRTNLEWLAKAVHWAKFSATASLGVIHKGHVGEESKSILSTYLPNPNQPDASPYSEGGALYALGLIHAGVQSLGETTELLLTHVRGGGSEALKAGACLGLGLSSLLSGSLPIFEDLLQTLYNDQAVAGEAAAFAIGLVMAGTGNARAIQELLSYGHETQHEKIIRGCAVSLALICLRREEEADGLIYQMTIDKDHIFRYGGVFAIGLAYCGTSNATAIRKLLHFSVSDVSDDVRRAAVMSLGFVMCNDPKSLPKVIKLLSGSYNPHLRYAAAMAIGMACAGRASMIPEAVQILEPLRKDSSDFVRQGAMLASGLLFMQTSDEQTNGRVGQLREELMRVLGDKHEDILGRFGAIIAFGLLDAGGRNSVARMYDKGNLRLGGAIGMVMFVQMWYWFPMIYFISLSLVPTAMVGLNERLKMPKNFVVRSEARPSLFAYPEPIKPVSKDEKKDVGPKVQLSTTIKRQTSRALRKGKDDGKETPAASATRARGDRASDIASNAASTTAMSAAAATMGSSLGDDKLSIQGDWAGDPLHPSAHEATSEQADATEMDVDKPEDKDKDADMAEGEKREDVAEKKEKTFEVLSNPSRVVPAQEACIRYYARGRTVSVVSAKDKEEEKEEIITRYEPVNPERKSGFLLLRDLDPEAPEILLEFDGCKAEEEEPSPPEPFDWSG